MSCQMDPFMYESLFFSPPPSLEAPVLGSNERQLYIHSNLSTSSNEEVYSVIETPGLTPTSTTGSDEDAEGEPSVGHCISVQHLSFSNSDMGVTEAEDLHVDPEDHSDAALDQESLPCESYVENVDPRLLIRSPPASPSASPSIASRKKQHFRQRRWRCLDPDCGEVHTNVRKEQRHMRKVHRIKMVRCEICGGQVARYDYLKAHNESRTHMRALERLGMGTS